MKCLVQDEHIPRCCRAVILSCAARELELASAFVCCSSSFRHYRIIFFTTIAIFPSSFTTGNLGISGFGTQSRPPLRVGVCISGLQDDSDTLFFFFFSSVQHQPTFVQFLSPEARPISESKICTGCRCFGDSDPALRAQVFLELYIFTVRSIYRSRRVLHGNL